MKTLLSALLFIGLAGNAAAQVKTVKDLSATVTAGGSVKYSDLLKTVLPDLDVDDMSGTGTVVVRHISGDHAPMRLEGQFEIQSVDAVTLRDPSGPITVLQFDLAAKNLEDNSTVYGNEAGIVAAFRTFPEAKLIDVFDVKTDKYTEFYRPHTLFPVGPNRDAFVIINSHDNSSQAYDQLFGFFLFNGRFAEVFDLFLLQSRGCGIDITQTPTFSPIADAGSRLYSVVVRIKVVKKRDDENCDSPTRGYIRFYSGVFKWDRATKGFKTASRELARLDRLNQKAM